MKIIQLFKKDKYERQKFLKLKIIRFLVPTCEVPGYLLFVIGVEI